MDKEQFQWKENTELLQSTVGRAHSWIIKLKLWNKSQEGLRLGMINWEWVTSLISEPLPCSAPRSSVSRIKSIGWLRFKDQCYVVGRKKDTIPYISTVRKKKRRMGEEGSLQLHLEGWYTELRALPLTFTPSRSGNILSSTNSEGLDRTGRERWYQLGKLGGWEAKAGGWWGSGGWERRWAVISRGQSLHKKQGGPPCSNWWELRARSKWQLSWESMFQQSWPAPSPMLGAESGEERKKKIEAKEKQTRERRERNR